MRATSSNPPEFEAWRARVIGYARAVMGLEIDGLNDSALREGFAGGDTPADFCDGALSVHQLPRRRVRDPRHASERVAGSADAIMSGR